MPTYVCDYQLPNGNRATKRSALISNFLMEEAGTGNKDNASRYQYNVESFGEYGIYLKRPTQLNKGFDFTVNVEGLYFKKNIRYSNPSHQDIFDALIYCQSQYPNEYDNVRNAIVDIYNCLEPDLTRIDAYFCDYSGEEHPIQIIILAIKWLFMEQDCAYWNYSGRRMFFEGLLSNGLV